MSVARPLEDDPLAGLPESPTNGVAADSALAGVADTLVSDMPEPQQHAIDEASREHAAEGEAVEVDALGVPWNKEFHATGADGKGVKTAKGTWRKRRGVSGSASSLGRGATSAQDKPAELAGPTQNEIACRRAGMMVARMQINISVGVLGPDYLPRVLEGPGGVKLNELEMMEQAWGDYFVAKDITDLPPGWALLGVMVTYYMPRFQAPATKEKVKGVFGWLRNKYADWKVARMKRKWARSGGARGTPPEQTQPASEDGAGNAE